MYIHTQDKLCEINTADTVVLFIPPFSAFFVPLSSLLPSAGVIFVSSLAL